MSAGGRAVFLDRDGTLNREQGFVTNAADLQLLPGVRAALAALAAAGFRRIVVTNQSGIAQGLYSEADLQRTHLHLQHQVAGLIDAFLHCPHHPASSGPYGGACNCRKPQGGLLHQARELLGVAFDGSYLIGDSARDVRMVRGLPIRTVLVRSGKPVESELEDLAGTGETPDHIADDLPDAVAWLLAQP